MADFRPVGCVLSQLHQQPSAVENLGLQKHEINKLEDFQAAGMSQVFQGSLKIKIINSFKPM